MLNPENIGRKSEEREIVVEHGQLKLFAKAIFETNPIYFDKAAAKAAGHPDILAPPTFGNCLKLLAPSKDLSYDSLGIDYKSLLHAEEKIESYQPIYAGDRLTLLTEVVDMYEKKGGALEFLVMRTSIHRQGELVQSLTGTVVMRQEVA